MRSGKPLGGNPPVCYLLIQTVPPSVRVAEASMTAPDRRRLDAPRSSKAEGRGSAPAAGGNE